MTKITMTEYRKETWLELRGQLKIHTSFCVSQQARQEEMESSRRHFETWQQFWGRPGHGAPREVKVKGNIDVLLHRLPVK